MLKKIFSRFSKRNEVLSDVPSDTSAIEMTYVDKIDIDPFVHDIEKILAVTSPTITSVGCIYECYVPGYAEKQIVVQLEFRRHELPVDARFIPAHYLDDRDVIMIAKKMPYIDFDTQNCHFRNVKNAEKLFLIAHELRHVWQKKYAPETYYQKNAVNMEVVQDIAEIDADAFARAYVFSDRTPFNAENMPSLAEEICLTASIDNGKRKARTAELAKEYQLNCVSKLITLEASVDFERINYVIKIAKQRGMI